LAGQGEAPTSEQNLEVRTNVSVSMQPPKNVMVHQFSSEEFNAGCRPQSVAHTVTCRVL
jgi:hypothetical protein